MLPCERKCVGFNHHLKAPTLLVKLSNMCDGFQKKYYKDLGKLCKTDFSVIIVDAMNNEALYSG